MQITDLKRQMGQEIYFHLKKIIPKLPEYKFNINDVQNSGIVFLNTQPTNSKLYFDDTTNRLNYSIYYFASKSEHKNQLDNLDIILDQLIKIKEIQVGQDTFLFSIIYLNGKPFQPSNWTACDLDGFEDAFQVYKIDYEIVTIKKNKLT